MSGRVQSTRAAGVTRRAVASSRFADGVFQRRLAILAGVIGPTVIAQHLYAARLHAGHTAA